MATVLGGLTFACLSKLKVPGKVQVTLLGLSGSPLKVASYSEQPPMLSLIEAGPSSPILLGHLCTHRSP